MCLCEYIYIYPQFSILYLVYILYMYISIYIIYIHTYIKTWKSLEKNVKKSFQDITND